MTSQAKKKVKDVGSKSFKRLIPKMSIGELLVQNDLITRQQLMEVQKLERKNREQMLTVLVKSGFISEKDLMGFMSEQYNCQVIKIEDFEISPEIIKKVPRKVCEKYGVIPLSKIGDVFVFACSNPSDKFAKEELIFVTGCKIEFVIASANSIKEAIEIQYNEGDEDMHKIFAEIESSNAHFKQSIDEEDEEGVVVKVQKNDKEPIIRCVNRIITSAQQKRASDIHIESYEKSFRIRFRIDGALIEIFHPPRDIAPFIIARIKVMCKMDISEKRKPQDGRVKIILDGNKEVNFRVNTTPTVSGEKLVMRILDDVAASVNLNELGMDEKEAKMFKTAIHKPQGLVLITGPTGSGKTTTIYSGLKILNTSDKNISTAEDPVEYKVEGLNQVQVHPKIGYNFSAALRAFLRQDPDIILVGEIRDTETAEIAFKASSTGHLVVSTLHTNDTTSTVTRLLDMGIPDYSIAENTNLIVGQRLLKKICQRCIVVDKVSVSSLKTLGLNDEQIKRANGSIKKGKGCRLCSNLGSKGRIAVYEMLKITDEIKNGIIRKLSSVEMKKAALAKNEIKTLRQSGIENMLKGLVSFEDVFYGTIPDNE